jgi:acetyl-CoA C-acetyltransferase
MRKDLGYDFCRAESEKNPRVAGPLKRTDCSLVSDGAAALLITDTQTALRNEQGYRLSRARAQTGFPAAL